MEFRTSAAAAFFLARVFLPFMYIYGPRPAAGTAARAADRKKSPRAVASAARGAAAAAVRSQRDCHTPGVVGVAPERAM